MFRDNIRSVIFFTSRHSIRTLYVETFADLRAINFLRRREQMGVIGREIVGFGDTQPAVLVEKE